jgi:hypothetical protein
VLTSDTDGGSGASEGYDVGISRYLCAFSIRFSRLSVGPELLYETLRRIVVQALWGGSACVSKVQLTQLLSLLEFQRQNSKILRHWQGLFEVTKRTFHRQRDSRLPLFDLALCA